MNVAETQSDTNITVRPHHPKNLVTSAGKRALNPGKEIAASDTTGMQENSISVRELAL